MGSSSSKEKVRLLNQNIVLTHEKHRLDAIDKVKYKF